MAIESIILITPGKVGSLPAYDHTQSFNLSRILSSQMRKGYLDRFLLVTSENFLSKKNDEKKVSKLSSQEFNQANIEFLRCASMYPNAIFIGHGFVETGSSAFSNQISSELSKWQTMSNYNLYPYFPLSAQAKDSSIAKQNKIRNMASNFSVNNPVSFQYSLSTHYQNAQGKIQFKGMKVGNYHEPSKDILNLNISDLNYYNNVSLENVGPYYVNGYPDPLVTVGDALYFLMIGHDALNLWDLGKISEYTQKISTVNNSPLVIQYDSYSTDSKLSNSLVSPGNFFRGIFPTDSGDNHYPSLVTIEKNLTSEQQVILKFLKKLPYIVFAGMNKDVPEIGSIYFPSTDSFGREIFTRGTKDTSPLKVEVINLGFLDPTDPQGKNGSAAYVEYQITSQNLSPSKNPSSSWSPSPSRPRSPPKGKISF